MQRTYKTEFTEMFDIKLPIIGAPMFLVSNVAMVKAITEAGGIGTFPALNFRPLGNYQATLKQIREQTNGPYGVNIIVNKSNTRQGDDLRMALDNGASLFITSLGNPKDVIREAHKNGAKVFCDVTNVKHALKVQDLGADGVIAVASGAGGHAGPISPFVLIPWLKKELDIPVVAAGGIANGVTLASCLALGASAASIGTRFIASEEAGVDQAYKQAVVDSSPEDIVMTTRVSGTPAAVINTEYVKKMGTDLPYVIKVLKSNPITKKYVVPLIHLAGMKALQNAAEKPTWKTVWSAGQSVGLVHEISSCEKIVNDIADELFATLSKMNSAGGQA
ncbi:MAG: nitronate monooxygenase [Bdellovibrionales bacterium]|nr:nitronate monooxygenase [Bdellovibrionales bacterium]